MNVLSLFDGISCGQIALNRAGIHYDAYYASEVDKHAIKVTQHNYPDTIQLGDVRGVESYVLPKINLLMGGSPCQGFSFAGKQLNFEDPRSKLFFEYVRLKNQLQPEYFILENVKMKKEYQDVISEHMGCRPIEINSALVSAQNRKRLYWTNIPILIPQDTGVLVRDILDGDGVARWVNSHTQIKLDQNKSAALRASGGTDIRKRQKVWQINPDKSLGGKQPSMRNRVYDINGKTIALTQFCNSMEIGSYDVGFRDITPVEAERLQTIPDNYTSIVSKSQRYKQLGNSFTVDVIAHILIGIKDNH